MNKAIRFLAEQLRSSTALRDPNEVFAERLTLGERLADRVAVVGGSWGFIIGFGLFLVAWAVLNVVVLAGGAFDPYPFVFLNLILSMLAAIQAPIIMMSQNRQASKDRLEARMDYETNMRAEAQIAVLMAKLDDLHARLDLQGVPKVEDVDLPLPVRRVFEAA